jgi:hypothetical protein
MLSLPAKRFIPLFLLIFLVFVSACDDHATQVIIPLSTAPSALNTVINITDTVQSHSAQVTVRITVKGDSSTIIHFNTQESLSCDNVSLNWVADRQDYEAKVSEQPVGGAYTFIYTNYGKPATIAVLAPQVPDFTSPTKDAMVTRSTKLIVSYQAPGAWQVQINASDDAGNKTSVSVGKNTGSASIDTSSLVEGTGTLRLAADYNFIPESTDFDPVQVKYQMIVGTTVIWV